MKNIKVRSWKQINSDVDATKQQIANWTELIVLRAELDTAEKSQDWDRCAVLTLAIDDLKFESLNPYSNREYLEDLAYQNGVLGQELQDYLIESGMYINILGESGIVTSQAEQWAIDHPIRLTGDDIERDYLDGPNAMIDRGVSDDNMYFDSKSGQFRVKVNWDHIQKREQERSDLFFSISGAIIRYGNRGNKDKLASYAKRYWKWIITEGKTRDKSDPALTQDQAAGVAFLLDMYYKPNKAFKKNWSEVMGKIRAKRIEKVSDSDPTYVDGDEAYGYADSPEDELMARETVMLAMNEV